MVWFEVLYRSKFEPGTVDRPAECLQFLQAPWLVCRNWAAGGLGISGQVRDDVRGASLARETEVLIGKDVRIKAKAQFHGHVRSPVLEDQD